MSVLYAFLISFGLQRDFVARVVFPPARARPSIAQEILSRDKLTRFMESVTTQSAVASFRQSCMVETCIYLPNNGKTGEKGNKSKP